MSPEGLLVRRGRSCRRSGVFGPGGSNAVMEPVLIVSSLFITPNLSAAFLTRLLVVLPCTEDLQDPFTLDLFLEPSEGPLKRFVFSN